MDGYETVQLLAKILRELRDIHQTMLDMRETQNESLRKLHSIEVYGTSQGD